MKNAYTLFGHPLGHSMSPFIHERLFALSGIEATYTLSDIEPDTFVKSKELLQQYAGFNITIPYKTTVIPLIDQMDESAERYASVNCVANRDGVLVGYNTDCDGFTMSVKSYPMDKKVLLIGCGGVGRMMATEAVRAGADLTIGIIPEDRETVTSFLDELQTKYPHAQMRLALTQDIDDTFDVILNASPVGMTPKTDACPVPDKLIERCSCCFDVIYNPTQTLFLRKAAALGKQTKSGTAMLVLQAVRAHEIWYGGTFTDAQIQTIIQDMEAELRRQNHA